MGCCGSSASANSSAGAAYAVAETSSAATAAPEEDKGDRAPPKRTQTLDLVAAGHASKGGAEILAMEDEDGNGCGTILKLLDETEFEVYKRLTEEFRDDPVMRFIPRFQGALESQDENGNEAQFIRITNLLHGFVSPKVMDVKIGVRTFLESECQNKKPRPDLYEKMAKMYPAEVEEAEHADKAVTKHRWMTVRDKVTTIGTMGYRIDGIAGHRQRNRKDVDKELARVITPDDAADCFKTFAEDVATDENNPKLCDGHTAVFVAERIRQLLAEMRAALERSDFVRRHEFIGSSILIVADAFGHFNASWIDFAKTSPIQDGMHVTHLEPWVMGNHEDGILIGFNSLVESWDKAVGSLRMEDQSTGGGVSSMLVAGFESGRPRPSILPSGNLPSGSQEQMDAILEDRRQSLESSSLMSAMTKDLALLSSLPALSGVVADARGKLWQAGAKARILASGERKPLDRKGSCSSFASAPAEPAPDTQPSEENRRSGDTSAAEAGGSGAAAAEPGLLAASAEAAADPQEAAAGGESPRRSADGGIISM